METEVFVVGASVAGIIGVIAPFVLPFLFKLIVKFLGREITKEEKRLITTILAVLVAAAIMGFQYPWTGDIKADLINLAQLFFVNFASVKGMIQFIYESIVKGIPSVDRELEKLSGN